MTNFELIKGMDIDELARLLEDCEGGIYSDSHPWDKMMERACDECAPIIKNGHEYSYCELDNCPYGYSDILDVDLIKRWLELEVEDEDNKDEE